jgi:hypothetical protein
MAWRIKDSRKYSRSVKTYTDANLAYYKLSGFKAVMKVFNNHVENSTSSYVYFSFCSIGFGFYLIILKVMFMDFSQW